MMNGGGAVFVVHATAISDADSVEWRDVVAAFRLARHCSTTDHFLTEVEKCA